MNKTKQKRANYNTQAVEKTAEYYSYTPRYVRMCLRGDAKGIMADAVVKKYREFVSYRNKTRRIMKTKTIYHLNYDCDKVVRIEVIQKTKKKKKSLVNKTKRKERSSSLPPEKICEIYNGLATSLGWSSIDIIEIKKLNKTPSIELPKNKVQDLFCKEWIFQ